MADAPTLAEQQAHWNRWNAETREHGVGDVSADQQRQVQLWLAGLGRTDLSTIDVGCGAGWLCPTLMPFGRVTATDLSDEVLGRARERFPEVTFVAGDFATLPFEPASFDVVVSLEVLSHVADQPAFVAKIAEMLRPGGALILATQNRTVLERFNRVNPAQPGQLRHWVNGQELRALLAAHFDVLELKTLTPKANRGLWRALNTGGKLDRILRPVFGDAPKHLKEKLGFGWTLMALARKR